jgi:hypothetical protein
MGIEQFHQALIRHMPDAAPTATQSADALRNLAGFFNLLIKIDREINEKGSDHDDHGS